MTERDPLDDLFAEARQNPPVPSEDFLARVLADAESEQPVASMVRRPSVVSKGGFWSSLFAALGGAAAVAGVSSAAMVGLVVGYVQPEALVNLASSYGISESAGGSFDLLPGYESLLAEETTQ
ncbi:dihydroorotate dehydrogenase [Thioclava sp. FR2]|uniref:dihydroorotate dehydrogenase n=1 Tax=Thioclava sp. FR2 TaxID=3445780 RepID=UPI003EC0B320